MVVENIPGFCAAPVRTRLNSGEPYAAVDSGAEVWAQRIRRLSAVFRSYPAIQDSWIRMEWGLENSYFLDSEGTRLRLPSPNVELFITGKTQAKDGMEVQGVRYFNGITPAQ